MKPKLICGITILLFITGCVSESASLSNPIASSSCWWIQSDTLERVWPYFEQEKVQKFGLARRGNMVDPPQYVFETTEPKRIKVIMDLLRKALEEEEEREKRGVYGWSGTIILSGGKQMIIITDQHKYAIFIEWDEGKIYGMEWVSSELKRQLWKWGYGRKYKYNLPSKENIVAILLYHNRCVPYYPIAIFGDKELAKESLLGIKDREGKIRFSEYAEEFKSKKVFEGRDWLEKIMDAYEVALKQAEEKEEYFPSGLDAFDTKILFIPREKDGRGNYWKGIGIGKNFVYDDYIKSEKLKTYFDELGLTDELLAGEPNKAPAEEN